MIDKPSASPHQDIAAADQGQIGLGIGVAVAKGGEQSRVQAPDTGQVLGVHPVALGIVLVDEAQLAGVGHVDLVVAVLKQTADPGGVGTGFQHHAYRRHAGKAAAEGQRCGSQPGFLKDLAARIEDADLRVLVSQVQTHRDLALADRGGSIVHGQPPLNWA